MSDHREELKDEYHYPNSVMYTKNDEVEKLEVALRTCQKDYWFMINLLERYSTDKDEAIRDCIERMKFRKPIFEILKK